MIDADLDEEVLPALNYSNSGHPSSTNKACNGTQNWKARQQVQLTDHDGNGKSDVRTEQEPNTTTRNAASIEEKFTVIIGIALRSTNGPDDNSNSLTLEWAHG